MEFTQFNQILNDKLMELLTGETDLFSVGLTDNDELWNLYLDSFKPEDNPIFRERREYDCQCCRRFIRQFGNVVSIIDNRVVSYWRFTTGESKYQPVIDALANAVESKVVANKFFSEQEVIGTAENYEVTKSGFITWEHFHVEIPSCYVAPRNVSVDTLAGKYKTNVSVLKSSFDLISRSAINVVLDLIAQNSLERGKEREEELKRFLELHTEYHSLPTDQKDNYCWQLAGKVGGATIALKNSTLGQLLMNIDTDELDIAVFKYEQMIDPTKYKQPRAIYTEQMKRNAQKFAEENGYMQSFGRRFATINDITANNVLFIDNAAVITKLNDVFDMLPQTTVFNPKTFSKLESVSIEDFIKNVISRAERIELFTENAHLNNFVSVIAPKNMDGKSFIQWDNQFTLAYSGNLAMASKVKENVVKAGGDVNGVMRFSIMWNDNVAEHNNDDYDAHCKITGNSNGHIYYASRRDTRTIGQLDVDIRCPISGEPAVENITFPDADLLDDKTFTFYVHNYDHRNGKDGFIAELEIAGEVHTYEYRKRLRDGEEVQVVTVKYTRASGFVIISEMDSADVKIKSQTKWGITTNTFVPVQMVMYSPNFWDGQSGMGHKHFVFALQNCISDETPNGFYNEFLKNDLMPYKHVFQMLGSMMKVEPTNDQLSGLGFSSTRRDSVIVKVIGATTRMIRVTF